MHCNVDINTTTSTTTTNNNNEVDDDGNDDKNENYPDISLFYIYVDFASDVSINNQILIVIALNI